MGTDELCMGWIKDETGRAVGLPRVIGGIPLDEIGATGFRARRLRRRRPRLHRPRAQGRAGRGAGLRRGRQARRALSRREGRRAGGRQRHKRDAVDRDGLDVAALIDAQGRGRALHEYPHGREARRDAIIDVPCDIWIPAARPDVIRADNVARLQTRLVPQGANIPCTPEAEPALHERGVLVVPDFIANAGGVICAAIEYRGGTQRAAFDYIDERIRTNTRLVLEESRRSGGAPRAAAMALAQDRLRAATKTRRWQ